MKDRTDGPLRRICETGCDSPDCGYCQHIRRLVAAAPAPSKEQARALRLILSSRRAPMRNGS